jgi:hypothetical protein
MTRTTEIAWLAGAAFAAVAAAPAPALAAEKIDYSYDARGRLIQVARSAGSAATTTTYGFDKADNRLLKTVSGGSAPPPTGPTGPTGPEGPTLSIADASGAEGSNIVFNVTKTGGAAAYVYWTFNDVSAAYGSDYLVENGGFLEWGANETTKTITTTALNDSIVEPAEAFRVTLYNPSGATLARGQALGTITGPAAGPTLSISDASGAEGSNIVFTVTKTGSAAAFVYWSFGDVSAAYGSD